MRSLPRNAESARQLAIALHLARLASIARIANAAADVANWL